LREIEIKNPSFQISHIVQLHKPIHHDVDHNPSSSGTEINSKISHHSSFFLWTFVEKIPTHPLSGPWVRRYLKKRSREKDDGRMRRKLDKEEEEIKKGIC
jgi:hypothetical protein